MTDRGGGPGQNAEQTVNRLAHPNANPLQDVIPQFVCVLPCTKPPIKYLDRLDGCASGIHVTLEEAQDLYMLYGKMADVIMAKDAAAKPSTESGTQVRAPDPCAVCLDPIVPSPTSPMLYLENCTHYYHYECHLKWRDNGRMDCPHCRVISSRALLWPQLFPNSAAKDEIIQLQKRCFGLYLSPQTVLMVNECRQIGGFPVFDLAVWVDRSRGYKCLTVRKRPTPPLYAAAEAFARLPSQLSMRMPPLNEEDLVAHIQQLHLADQPRAFFLGDILPLEENCAQYRAKYGPEPPMDEHTKRQKLLFQFVCPFDRVVNGPPNGVHCSQGHDCEFWHGWPDNTPAFMVERVKFRDFPRFFCMKSSRNASTGPKCIEPIRVHDSRELVRCLAGFHPFTQDLQDIDGFACKMAKRIMEPIRVPKPEHLVCAFCHKSGEPNSVWIHLQRCTHCLHVNCLSIVRGNSSHPNRKLDCPTCHVSSMRTLAWPGSFQSDTMKEAIFERQLEQFMLHGLCSKVQADTQLEIVELASGHSQGRPLPKLVNIFTVDYGWPTVAIINAATAKNNSTIWYD